MPGFGSGVAGKSLMLDKSMRLWVMRHDSFSL